MRMRVTSRRRGLTLVETVVSMGILFLAGIGTIAAIIYTRQMMELNKQTLTAMNYARQLMEAASTHGSIDSVEDMTVLRFNDPGLNVNAKATLRYHPIIDSGADAGQVDWTTWTLAAEPNKPYYCRAVLQWNSAGSMGRERNVTISTIVRAGTL